jgi:hypothetical protein
MSNDDIGRILEALMRLEQGRERLRADLMGRTDRL